MAQINLKASAGMSPAPRTFGFLDGSSYDEFGTQIKAPSVNSNAGLPTLSNKSSTPVASPTPSATNTSDDPITKFNLGLLELLKKAQGFDQTKLLNERNRLALAQTTQSMGSADSLGLGGLKPGDALEARRNQSSLYKPEINNLTDRLQASVQAVSQFESAIKAAKEYGEEMAKNVKPTLEDIQAVQEMLIAGENPGQDVLNATAKYIDWKAIAAAKKDTTKRTQIRSINNREVLVDLDTGEVIKDLGGTSYKPTGNDGEDKGTMSERQGKFISETRNNFNNAKGSDQKINPDGYRAAMYEYEKKGYGTIEEFKKKFPPETWLDPNNLVDDLSTIEA